MIIVFTAKELAKDLWDFGEDNLINQALRLDDKALHELQRHVQDYLKPEVLSSLGKVDGHYNLGLLSAAAFVARVEGKVRPLKRQRRRNQSSVPDYLKPSLEETSEAHVKFWQSLE